MFKSTQRYVIFSPMEGRLVQAGQPLPNTKIIRKLRWNGNEGGLIERFHTDEDGYFTLPMYEEELELGMLDQFVAKAELTVEHEGTTEHIWYSSKLRSEVHEETNGPIEKLICDIAGEEKAEPMGPTAILTKCRWRNI